MPRISIIVPIYNCENYLNRCIDSILAQTFRDFELILVDDGSTDNCPVICDEYEKRDSRVSVIHKANGGAATARNTGLSIAKGEYIGFIDGDDYVHPQYYEILLNVAQKTEAEIAACHYQFVAPKTTKAFSHYDEDVYESIKVTDCDEILQHFDEHCRKVSLISPCMRICKASLFNDLRFEEGYIEEDSMLLLPLLENANRIAKIGIPIYYWVENPNSVTRTAFSAKRFAFVYVSLLRAKFFEKRRDIRLSRIFRKEYMNRIIAFYIKAKRVGLLKEYAGYLKEYRGHFWTYIFDSEFCKMEYAMHLAFYFRIPIWKIIYDKLRPIDTVYLQ